MLSKENKENIIKEYRLHENDKGSMEVQIAILTHRIIGLQDHFKNNIHDFSSKRGLMRMINRRKSCLKYLGRVNNDSYKKIIQKLNIRK